MADETGKEQHHANLAAEHKRLAEFHESHSGGALGSSASSGAPSGGSMGGFVGGLMAHKWLIMGAIAAVLIIIFVVIPAVQGNNNNTANQAPNNAAGNYVPTDISTALDNINTELSGLANQLGSGTSSSGPGAVGQPVFPTPTTNPPGSNYTLSTGGVTSYVAAGGESLSKIAKDFGVSFQQLMSVPANQKNFGKVGSSFQPGIGQIVYLPSGANVFGASGENITSFFQVGGSGPNTLSGISQLENISLSRIEQLNPTLSTTSTLQSGTYVEYQ